MDMIDFLMRDLLLQREEELQVLLSVPVYDCVKQGARSQTGAIYAMSPKLAFRRRKNRSFWDENEGDLSGFS
jgi:hypothetical protein